MVVRPVLKGAKTKNFGVVCVFVDKITNKFPNFVKEIESRCLVGFSKPFVVCVVCRWFEISCVCLWGSYVEGKQQLPWFVRMS